MLHGGTLWKLGTGEWLVKVVKSMYMNFQTAKLAEDEITGYILSADSTRRLAVFCNLSSIFTTNHDFRLLNFYSRPF